MMLARKISSLKRLCHAAVVALALISLFGAVRADADVMTDTISLFAADNYADTAAALEKITAGAHANTQAVLEALADRRLFVDVKAGVLFYNSGTDAIDASTGKALASVPQDPLQVRINNRLRGQIDAALGSVALTGKDPEKRRLAVEALGKAKNPADLPRIEAALKTETDARVKDSLTVARASIVINAASASPTDQMQAVATLAERSNNETLATLRQAAQTARADVRQAANAAIASIERRQYFAGMVQNVWYGLSLGSVLLLASAGLAITFGVMGVINMAHGEMVMIGAYTTYVVQEIIRAIAPGAIDATVLIALPMAFLVAGGVGVAIERGIIRFLYGRPLETLLATWGVSLILQQAIRAYFGASNVQVSTPGFMNGSFDFFGLSITYGRFWIIVFTLLAFLALQLVLKATPLGLQMRAVTQNRRMASSMGIRTSYVDALTFGLGCGVAGIAGVALSQIDNVAPNLGQSYIVDCFMVVVFGGVGNLWGTFVSAFSLGIANKLLEPIAGAVLGKITILVLLILFIQKRPRGLFALKGRAIEA